MVDIEKLTESICDLAGAFNSNPYHVLCEVSHVLEPRQKEKSIIKSAVYNRLWAIRHEIPYSIYDPAHMLVAHDCKY